MPEQSVLVIGASGFIGEHTVVQIVKQGYRVYATHLPAETPSSIAGATWIPCDLREPESMRAWPQSCDNLIYLAQSPTWRNFPDGAADVFEVNVAATLRAAEYARQAGVQRFIFTSTGSIYCQSSEPAREEDPIFISLPRRFYDASKIATELLLGPYRDYFSMIILRIFMPYGFGQDPKMLIPQMVRRVQEGVPISLHGSDGMIVNPIVVSDVAEVLERCLALGETVTLNVAGPEILTLREIGECIGSVLNIPPKFESQPGQPVPVLVGDTTALSKYLAWSPQTLFEIGLRSWISSNRAVSK